MGSTADKPLTAADLDALERLEREATPGPWPKMWPLGQAVIAADRRRNVAFGAALRNAAPRLLAAAREAGRLRAEVAMHKTNCAALWARLPHPFALTPAGPLCDFCGLSADAHAAKQVDADAAAWKARAERAEARLAKATTFDLGGGITISRWKDDGHLTVWRDGREAEDCGDHLGNFAAESFDAAWAAAERAAKEGDRA